ncbi:MAG: rhodanese-like domain-containing protein [Desulfobacterales bacterium]|jgi:rhodanese-related sulfurtransferase/rubrerythrin
MLNPGFENLSADQLRNYIETQEEKDYLLVDVRQPEEYTQAHIPGSKLIPLGELESRLVDLPSDLNVVFYCRSGARSQAASLMVVGSGIPLKRIYNLSGGIMAWNGATLADFPKVKVFEDIENYVELLLKSMDLEKGALRFYAHVVEKFADQPFAQMIAPLVKAEKIHAQSIYGFWEKISESPPPFEELFENLNGDILEGGEKLETIINRFETIEENPCLGLIELALNVEYAAYDLYRTMADQTEDERTRRVFLSVAQVEKSHMQMLANAVELCRA